MKVPHATRPEGVREGSTQLACLFSFGALELLGRGAWRELGEKRAGEGSYLREASGALDACQEGGDF
jgi:hypothetical protein